MSPVDAVDQVLAWGSLLLLWLGLLVGGSVAFMVIRSILTWWGSR